MNRISQMLPFSTLSSFPNCVTGESKMIEVPQRSGSLSAAGASAPRANILGVGISVINMNDALELSDALIFSGAKGYICVTDVHGVIEAQADAGFRRILNESFLTTPDGMPLVWASRLQGHRGIRRVYGPDYLIAMCEASLLKGYRHFFFGGGPGVAERLAGELTRKLPGLQVVGTYTPPYRPLNRNEESELEQIVRETRPDIFWVGLGSPKQERFMAQYCVRLEAKLMVGIGAAFDIHSGAVKEAPRWLQAIGLQWLHRLIQEPRRLWKRYAVCVPAFAWRIGLQFASAGRFGAQDENPVGSPAALMTESPSIEEKIAITVSRTR